MLSEQQDGYGQALYDYHQGKGGYEIIEREDGLHNDGREIDPHFTHRFV